jgi:ribosome biogenesis GTPase / thiamine phosphate phosphatase
LSHSFLRARVIRHDGATLTIRTPDGDRRVRNSLLLDPAPTVGDWLHVEDDRVVEVLPRTSLLRRVGASKDTVQDLAANVDIVLITCGADRPVKATRIHRSIAIARDAGAIPVVVLTKTHDHDVDVRHIELDHPGVVVIATSVLEGIGIDEIRDVIGTGTAVVLGESGAGKSTLTNALLGVNVASTGEVRGDAKGRHTTTSRQLHELPGGGVIIDTPGIRSVGIFTDPEAVDASFSEIGELALECRFHDCHHGSEPGCAVLAALADGSLDASRYESWRHLQREVAAAARRATPHEERRRGKQFSRAAKEGAANKRRDW